MTKKIFLCFYVVFLLCFCSCTWSSDDTCPSNLTVSYTDSSSIYLGWNRCKNASSYNVYYSITNDISSSFCIDGIYTYSYSLSGLDSGTTYYIWVSAINKDGKETDKSSVVSSKTLYTSPTGFGITSINTNSMEFKWNSLEGAASYNLYYNTSLNRTYSVKENIQSTSYTLSNLSADTEYYFYLTAMIGNEESEGTSVIQKETLGIDFVNRIYDLDEDGDGSSVTVNNSEGNDIYILKTNSSGTTIPKGNTRYVKDSNVSLSSSVRSVVNTNSTLSTDSISFVVDGEEIIREEHKGALEWRENPELFLESLDTSNSVSSSISRSVVSTSRVAVGDTREFYMDDENSSIYKESAELKIEGEYCYVWVCDSYYDNSSSQKNDNKLTTTQLQKIADTFDDLYELETLVFGSKYQTQQSGYIAPADKISIYITDIYKDFTENQNSGVLGYFWSKDFRPVSSIPYSNELEVIYIDSYFIDRYESIAMSTLGHEFQHMLNFVHHWKSTETWFNEMLSMLAEDMLVDKLGLDANTEGPQSRLYDFVSGYFVSGITDWFDDDYVLYSYAGAYAFGAFLVRNYGGIELLQAIAQSASSGWDAIIESVNTINNPDPALAEEDLLREFGRSMFYTNPTDSADIPSLNKKAKGSLTNSGEESFTYTFYPIDLNNFSFGYNLSVTFGPYLFEATQEGCYDLRPYGMTLHYYGNNSGSVTIDFSDKKNDNEKVYIIVQ